ncbi:DUF2878 domain-containing protein [Enterovibrio coralii]|uniref:Zinc ABC transporter permease n=1 Tax=Enterovibrio coralii TaxID=294935 RepID=A0A135ICV8_9GAMM|nr:DUF2878 domain-containing protein [Enterovibrio coralii]KXF83245.1 hypothetical protein ATN88_06035 [Enterovibrio coralii]
MRFVLISVLFNVYWFAAVVGQHTFLPFLVLGLIGAVFLDRTVLFAIPLFALIGIVGDSVLKSFDILRFQTEFLPIWLCLLWAGFAAYIWLTRDWLLSKPKWVLVVAGSVGGGLSYLAGERLGAVTFGLDTASTAAVLFAAWFGYAVTFIALLSWLANREEKCASTNNTYTG